MEFIPTNLLKTGSTTGYFPHEFHKIGLFKISRKFLGDIFDFSFPTKLQATNIRVAVLRKMTCLTKFVKLLPAKLIHIALKTIFMFECRCQLRCQDFLMARLKLSYSLIASSSWEAFSKKRIPGIDKTAANFLNSRQISGHYLLTNSFLSFGNIYKYSAQILNTPFLQNSSGQLLRLLANVFSSNTSAKMFALPG